jgi:hypothetical protein
MESVDNDKEKSTQQLRSSHNALSKTLEDNNGKRIENDKGGKKVVFCKHKRWGYFYILCQICWHIGAQARGQDMIIKRNRLCVALSVWAMGRK